VKDEIYKVAFRTGVPVTLVANAGLRVPDHALITMQVVSTGFDAADDWIAENSGSGTLVITADILLAERCIKAGASAVLGPTGKAFDGHNIAAAVATRAIMADLRAGAVGDNIGGPKPFSKADRSNFLQALDRAITKAQRAP